MVDPVVGLSVGAQGGGPGIGQGAVGVPFEIADTRVFRQDAVHDTAHEVGDVGLQDIEDKLVPPSAWAPRRLAHHPVRMFGVEGGVGVDHLRFDPQPEPDAALVRPCDEGTEATGQLGLVDLPVAQANRVVVPGVGVAEPAVVEQEELRTEVRRVVDEPEEPLRVERERGGLPVVDDDRPQLAAVSGGVLAYPAVEAATQGTHPFGRPDPDSARG